MRMVERFVLGKHPDQGGCEDVVVVTEHFAAVLDGSSDRTGRLYGGKLGGQWAAWTAAEVVEALPADADARQAVDAVTAALAEGERHWYPDTDPDVAPAGTCAAIYSRARQQVWRVGDSHILVDGVEAAGREAALDVVLHRARWALLEALRLAGTSFEELREGEVEAEVLGPLLRAEHHFSNLPEPHPLAYGQLNALAPVPDWLLEIHDVAGARELVLASDGYCEPRGTLAESERVLAADLAADPLRLGEHLSFRAVRAGWVSFDDRAYLRLAL